VRRESLLLISYPKVGNSREKPRYLGTRRRDVVARRAIKNAHEGKRRFEVNPRQIFGLMTLSALLLSSAA